MKNKLMLIAGMLVIANCQLIDGAQTTSAPVDRSSQYNDHPKYNFHGEIDNTDIYAIPLDNSEEEQNEELEEFEKESEENKLKK